MIPAQRIIRTVSENWRLIEILVNRFAGLSFSIQDVQHLIAHQHTTWNGEQVHKEAIKLLHMDIIIPQAKSSHLQLNQAVLEFAQYLLHEQELGLADEISLLIDNLKRLARKLETSINNKDLDDTRRYCRQMDDRIRKIGKQFTNNENAIQNTVEQAKADLSNLSLDKRYKAVIEAFDEYIAPMLDMIDITGGVKQTFDEIELILSNAITQIEKTGLLASEKELLIQLRSRILEMHGNSLTSLRKCSNLLMPLREEMRKNTLLTKQVTDVLAQLRKKGVDATLSASSPHLSSDIQKGSLGTHNQITAYMAELVDYTEEQVEMPDLASITSITPPALPDFETVLAQAKQHDHTTHLLNWLNDTYPDIGVDETLYLYQKLANTDDITTESSQLREEIQVKDLTLSLYPYRQTANTQSPTASELPDAD